MSANNYPQFDAAVSELTGRVENLITRVQQTETYHNITLSEEFAQDSAQSATAAAASATSAAESQTTATVKAAEAVNSAASAATGAATAVTKAADSATSAAGAATSATKSQKWAEEPENTAVEAGKYSAKHHAAKASASAATATTKATEAANSASSAASSATTATTKATEASTSATNSSNSQVKAQKWAEEPENTVVEAGKYSAKHHAAKASASATTATTKATEASTSATNAASSATTATTKATEASTSATNAASSAATATTKATEAAGSASTASTGAATATTKATEAAGSASTASTGAATATTKAAEASASSAKAQKWAEEGVDVQVEAGKHSAKHHATKAAASSASAATSEAAALVSKQAAQAAESAASSSASMAQTYRDQAHSAAASLTGSLVELGGIDLSSGSYPAKPSNGAFWKVTVGGTAGGEVYGVGDTLVYSKNLDQFYKIDNTEAVSSVNGETGTVTVTPAKIGALPVGGTAAAATKLVTARTINGVAFDGTANITVADSTKEPSIAAGTSSQFWAGDKTWKDLVASVRAAVLTGLSTATGSAVVATDSLLVGLGKLQAQITAAANGLADNVRSTVLTGYLAGTAAPLASTDTVLSAFGKVQGQLNSKLEAGGNIATATKLASARTLTLGASAKSFDGSANVSWTLAEMGAAPLTSPALTGTPTVPTASPGVSTTQVASTAFVQSVVNGQLALAGLTGGTRVLTSDEAANAVIALSGALTSALVVELPTTANRIYSISNGTTGAFSVSVRCGPNGAAVAVAQGKRKLVFSTASGAYDAINDFDSIALTGASTCVTAPVGTNTTQIASTAYAVAEIASRAPTKTGGGASGTWAISCSGNAATASALQTARTINGVSFNGTANITVADATKLPLAGGTLTGVVEAPMGIHGGYANSNGSGADWGANIWGMGSNYDGAGQGVAYNPANSFGLSWIRGSHTSANAAIGEGLYVYQSGALQGGIGTNGIWTDGAIAYGSVALGPTAVNIDNLTANGVETQVSADTTGTFNFFQAKAGIIKTYNDGTHLFQIHYDPNGVIWSRSKLGAAAWAGWLVQANNSHTGLIGGSCTFNGAGAITMLRNTAGLNVSREAVGVYAIAGAFGDVENNKPAVAMTNGNRIVMTQAGNGTNLKLTTYAYNAATAADSNYVNVILGN